MALVIHLKPHTQNGKPKNIEFVSGCPGHRMDSDSDDLDDMLLGVTGTGKRKAAAKKPKKAAKKRRVAESDEALLLL